MPDHRLLKTQMNDVFLVIREAGLQPIEFKFSGELLSVSDGMGTLGDLQTNIYHRIVHEPSKYECLFEPRQLSYSPGATTRRSTQAANDWNAKLLAVSTWLKNLKREIDAPDLWRSLAEERAFLDSSEPFADDNTQFTETERKQIKLGIEQLRSYITKMQTLNEENARKVNARLDYLISASEQLGRIHWKDIFVGTLISIAWQLALPDPGFHDFISFGWRIFRHLFGYVASPHLLQ